MFGNHASVLSNENENATRVEPTVTFHNTMFLMIPVPQSYNFRLSIINETIDY